MVWRGWAEFGTPFIFATERHRSPGRGERRRFSETARPAAPCATDCYPSLLCGKVFLVLQRVLGEQSLNVFVGRVVRVVQFVKQFILLLGEAR